MVMDTASLDLTTPKNHTEDYPEPRGLVRHRLIKQLTATRFAKFSLIVAPAGYGKTTLLSHYSRIYNGPVVWYSIDINKQNVSERLAEAITATARPGTLLILDNVDQLIGTPDEERLEYLLASQSRGRHVLLSSRRMLELNFLRHEISIAPGVIGPEQLRFRPWEVGRLLSEVHGEPLPPTEVALLTRHTGGWAAGLALFHLSTRGRPLLVRQRAVRSLSHRWSIARAYLTKTILADLPPEIHQFLIHISVFEVITADRCDLLLNRTDSHQLLDECARKHGLLITADGGQTYTGHQMLRHHLTATFTENIGDDQARQWYSRAARILTDEHAYMEASHAYIMAGEWHCVSQLMDRFGDVITDHGFFNPKDLPLPPNLAESAWFVYAQARWELSNGNIEEAVDKYTKAEPLFVDEHNRSRCTREKEIASLWLPQRSTTRIHWSAWLREALCGHPAVIGEEAITLPGISGDLVRLAARVLTGNLRTAMAHVEHPRPELQTDSSMEALGLRLLRTALMLSTGMDVNIELERIIDEAESIPWLLRMARAVRTLSNDPDSAHEAYSVAEECERYGDRWGHVIATFIACLRGWRSHNLNIDVLTRLTYNCQTLNADVLQAWALALLALADTGATTTVGEEFPDAYGGSGDAIPFASAKGVEGARILATIAQDKAKSTQEDEAITRAKAEAIAWGIPFPWYTVSPKEMPSAPLVHVIREPRPVSITCFGGFQIVIDGKVVDITSVRARARSALRLLSTYTGQAIHKEVLVEALWPDLPMTAAIRNLQVTISALRGLLKPSDSSTKIPLLVRSGEAYSIALPPGGFCDTVTFMEAVSRWKRIRHSGDLEAEAKAMRTVLSIYSPVLLPEEGPANWVVEAREHFHRQAIGIARTLANVELSRNNTAEAITIAEYCLSLDSHDDEAWRILIRAYTDNGAIAKATEVRQRYANMLASLGLSNS